MSGRTFDYFFFIAFRLQFDVMLMSLREMDLFLVSKELAKDEDTKYMCVRETRKREKTKKTQN